VKNRGQRLISRSKAAALVAASLVACATGDPDLGAARDSWQGADYEAVVRAWGQPARSSVRDGRESHTWVSEDSMPRHGAPGGVYGGVVIGSGGAGGVGGIVFGAAGDPVRCDRTLVFSGGKVVEQTWTGPAVYCNRFKK
jgi:hypothetical protein